MAMETDLTDNYSMSHERFWSVLPPVPLQGIGTPMVESLEYYVQRVSKIAGVSLSSLVQLLTPSDSGDREKVARTIVGFSGLGHTYKERVIKLEKLTGVSNLRCGTLWVLGDLLATPGYGRDTRFRRWCPECIQNWDRSTSWEPLLWSFNFQKVCPIHGCALEEVCRHCGGKQGVSSEFFYKYLLCSSCRSPLGCTGRAIFISNEQRWVQNQLQRLIKLCATPGQTRVSKDTCRVFMQELRAANEQLDNEENLEAVTIARALASEQFGGRVTVGGLIGTCAITAVSMEELLLAPKQAAARQLIDPIRSYQPLCMDGQQHSSPDAFVAACIAEFLTCLEPKYLPRYSCIERFVRRATGLPEESRRKRQRWRHRGYASTSRADLARYLVPSIRRADEAFRIALDIHRQLELNPFERFQCRYANRAVSEEASIPLEAANFFVQSAALLRRSIERVKASQIGLGYWDLRTHEIFGGLIAAQLRVEADPPVESICGY